MSCPVENGGSAKSQGGLDNGSQGTDYGENNLKTSVYDDFPVDLADPFENATCDSDVVLLVEDRRMHVHRCILSVHSPVFKVMLNSPAFVEKEKTEIHLPGKKYDAMKDFLKHLYPVYSIKGITDYQALETVLPLAEEYQVEHVRRQCKHYVESRLDSIRADMKAVLQYLLLCDLYNLADSKDKLVDMAVLFCLETLESEAMYQDLSQVTKSTIQRKRCQRLEGVLKGLNCINSVLGYVNVQNHSKHCSDGLEDSPYMPCYACLIHALKQVEQFKRTKINHAFR